MDQLPSGLQPTLHHVAQALFDVTLWSALIQFAGALLIMRSVVLGTWLLLRTGDTGRVRLLVADGVLWVLSFTLAATLLNSVLVHTWLQILTFAVIVAFRFLLRRLFAWERARLLALPSRR